MERGEEKATRRMGAQGAHTRVYRGFAGDK